MSPSLLIFFAVVGTIVFLWKSGVIHRWQERREKQREVRDTEDRRRRRELLRQENRRRSEGEEQRLRILARSAPSAEQKRRTVGRSKVQTLEVAGRKPGLPVVLLHDFAGRKEEWGAVIEHLAPLGCSILAPDLPSCGSNPGAEGGDYDVPAQTRWVRSLAEQLKLLPCHLVAAGTGGTVAALWAARNPESIVSLTLIEPFGFRVPHSTALDRSLEAGRNPLLPRSKSDLGARRDLLFAGTPQFLDSESEILHEEDLIRNHAHHSRAWERSRAKDRVGLLDVLAPEIRAPVLYLQGAESQVVHPKTAELVESLLGSRAEVHLLSGCGHLPALERPQETVSLLLAFWRRITTED